MARYTLPTTREQRLALKRVYDRQPLRITNRMLNGHPTIQAVPAADGETRITYRQFRKLVKGPFHKSDAYLMVPWCGMWLGIEPDGYCHS